MDFHVDKTVTAQPASAPGVGVDVSFEVVFDPSSVGDCRSQVTLTSPVGGDYIFPLRATCTLPKPQVCLQPFVVLSSRVLAGRRAGTIFLSRNFGLSENYFFVGTDFRPKMQNLRLKTSVLGMKFSGKIEILSTRNLRAVGNLQLPSCSAYFLTHHAAGTLSPHPRLSASIRQRNSTWGFKNFCASGCRSSL